MSEIEILYSMKEKVTKPSSKVLNLTHIAVDRNFIPEIKTQNLKKIKQKSHLMADQKHTSIPAFKTSEFSLFHARAFQRPS